MKYLVIYRANPTAHMMLPLPAVVEIVEAGANWMDEMKKAGRIECAYFFGADHGGAMIVDITKPSDLLAIIDACPTRPLCDVETIPLLTVAEWREPWAKMKPQMLEMFNKMKAMMPK